MSRDQRDREDVKDMVLELGAKGPFTITKSLQPEGDGFRLKGISFEAVPITTISFPESPLDPTVSSESVKGTAGFTYVSQEVTSQELIALLDLHPTEKVSTQVLRLRRGPQPPTPAGLEEMGAVRNRMREALGALGRRAPNGVTPVVIGRLLQEQDSRWRLLTGLEEQGIYVDDGDDPSLLSRMIARQPGAHYFLFAGLEEETIGLGRLAVRAGMTFRVTWPKNDLLTIFAQMAGLEEGFLGAQADFQELRAGWKALGSGA